MVAVSLSDMGSAVRLVVSYDASGLRVFAEAAETLVRPSLYERALHEGVRAAGDKVRTVIRKTLYHQMGVRTYGRIVRATRSYIPARMQYAIDGSGKGLPITDFSVRAKKRASLRWSPSEHWRVQTRGKDGRFGVIKKADEAGVTAKPWRVVHNFKRSFVDSSGVFRAMLPGKTKGRGRKLYGPSVAKEIVRGATAEAFERDGQRELQIQVGKKLARILAGSG